MLLTAKQFKQAIPALEEADKALTQMAYRDLVATAQANVFFSMGIKNPDLMKAGFASYTSTLSGFKTDMIDIITRFRVGSIGMEEAMKSFKGVCGLRYERMFRAGTMAVGNPYYAEMKLTKKDFAFMSKARRVEMNYFRKFLVDIKNPAHVPVRHPYLQRAEYYAESGKAQFFNGMASGAGTEMVIHWVLGVPMTAHCSVCPIYASRTWTWQTLPTVPRGCDTPCLMKCYCHLEFQQKTTGKYFDFAGRGSAEALLAPGRQARVLDATGTEIGGVLQDDFEAYYASMYKARQMIALTGGREKLNWISTRKEINQLIIDRMGARGLRVVPTIAVKDLMATIKAAAAKGGTLVDDFRVLIADNEVIFVRGDYSSVGVLARRGNQLIFRSPTGVELVIKEETDIIFLTEVRSPFSTGKIIDEEQLFLGGANKCLKVKIDGEKGIYKPLSGESSSLKIATEGSLYEREVAAYKIAKEMGWGGLVPETVIKTGSKGIGSVQHWITEAKVRHEASLWLGKVSIAEKARLTAFDIVIGNYDRHGANFLINSQGKIFAIDNGFAFCPAKDVNVYYTYTWYAKDLHSIPISQDIRDACQKLISKKNAVTTMLRSLHLQRDVINDIWVRINRLLYSETFGDYFKVV